MPQPPQGAATCCSGVDKGEPPRSPTPSSRFANRIGDGNSNCSTAKLRSEKKNAGPAMLRRSPPRRATSPEEVAPNKPLAQSVAAPTAPGTLVNQGSTLGQSASCTGGSSGAFSANGTNAECCHSNQGSGNYGNTFSTGSAYGGSSHGGSNHGSGNYGSGNYGGSQIGSNYGSGNYGSGAYSGVGGSAPSGAKSPSRSCVVSAAARLGDTRSTPPRALTPRAVTPRAGTQRVATPRTGPSWKQQTVHYVACGGLPAGMSPAGHIVAAVPSAQGPPAGPMGHEHAPGPLCLGAQVAAVATQATWASPARNRNSPPPRSTVPLAGRCAGGSLELFAGMVSGPPGCRTPSASPVRTAVMPGPGTWRR